MADDAFYDELETRDPDARERDLFGRLPQHIAAAKDRAPGWASFLAGIDPLEVTSRERLAELPVLRKSDLAEFQKQVPPFGGFTTSAPGRLARLFMSPGPIFDPEGGGEDWWRVARPLHAAGIRAGDIVHNSFAYHLTPAGHMFDSGARALGCAVIPAGIGNTEMQVQAIAALRPVAYAGTPDYLKVLLDAADKAASDASSIRKGLVSGAALPASLRAELSDRGVEVLQCYGTADLGSIAYESSAREGMIVDEQVILEIVRPGTGEPVPVGDVGEVVVTSFNGDYPMIRFATGDMSAVLSGTSPCGRTNMRIRGWMGRADQAAKVKGMFVRPEQIAEIAKRHPEVGRLRLVVSRAGEQDVMTLQAEAVATDPALAAALEATMRDICKLRGTVDLVAPDSLPNDGLVIADTRKID